MIFRTWPLVRGRSNLPVTILPSCSSPRLAANRTKEENVAEHTSLKTILFNISCGYEDESHITTLYFSQPTHLIESWASTHKPWCTRLDWSLNKRKSGRPQSLGWSTACLSQAAIFTLVYQQFSFCLAIVLSDKSQQLSVTIFFGFPMPDVSAGMVAVLNYSLKLSSIWRTKWAVTIWHWWRRPPLCNNQFRNCKLRSSG